MKTRIICRIALHLAVFSLFAQKLSAQIPPQNMVWIGAGYFLRGATNAGAGFPEHPVSNVYLDAFHIDMFEISGALWDEVYQWALLHGYQFDNQGESKQPNHPVHSISWCDMLKWCNARSEKEGKTPAYYANTNHTVVYRQGQENLKNAWVKWTAGYRLPTEAEWEKAGRGGLVGKRFPWGDTISHSNANYNSYGIFNYDLSLPAGYHPSYTNRPKPYTSPVGSFAPNGFGLYDMAGNVSERCWDQFSPIHGSVDTNNPHGRDMSYQGRTSHVDRGGAWGGLSYFQRVSFRNSVSKNNEISYTIGFRTVLPSSYPNWAIAFTNLPPIEQPVYSCDITRKPGKDSLVLITHGWIRKQEGQTSPPNPDWVDAMVEALRENLASRGLNNWQVESYKWTNQAWMKTFDVLRDVVLENAEKEGVNLGNCISDQGWNQVHLIGHSAGAALIQGACISLKSNRLFRGQIQLTFLDPYVGSLYAGKTKFGKGANWVENYFSRDRETYDFIASRTAGGLTHAYNVDVTWLDPHKEIAPVFISASSPFAKVVMCEETVTSHEWPHEFYLRTIPTNSIVGSDGFGFPLSKEGGNWNFATNNYREFGEVKVLGSESSLCFPAVTSVPPRFESTLDPRVVPWVKSDSGIVENSDGSLKLTAESSPFRQKTGETPTASAWFQFGITATNPVNLVSFESAFTSGSGGEGILSLYWGTNLLGSIDERVELPGIREHVFTLPETAENGLHSFGFRLDVFSSQPSSILVTNVALGFSGGGVPFRLSIGGKDENGIFIFAFMSSTRQVFTVEASRNLLDWEPVATLVNTNGIVYFTNPLRAMSGGVFYRAVRQ